MPVTLHALFASGLRQGAVRKWLAPGLIGLVLLATLLVAGRHALGVRDREALAREQLFSVSARSRIEWCVEGAVLFNDVRWAVACRALAEQGRGDGIADCDLPDDVASRLYTSLQQDERKCTAEVQALRVQ